MFRYTFHIGVSDYVTRRRLTCCARELISTNRSVLDIAMDWGYNSPEVFTRAFSRVWGESPAVFRKNRRFSGLFPKLEISKNEKEVSEMTEMTSFVRSLTTSSWCCRKEYWPPCPKKSGQ